MRKTHKSLLSVMVVVVLIMMILVPVKVEAANGVWKQTNGRWWYQYANGSYAHSEYIDGYWLDSAGWYDSAWNGCWRHDLKGWWFESGNWYPTNYWLKIDGSWYYFKNSGYMACSEWIGNYYLSSSGAMATNTWIGDYYVGSDGAWVPNKNKETSNTTEQNANKNNTIQNNNPNNNQNNNNQNTTPHTHTWVTTYTIFDPSFNCKHVAIPIDGYAEDGRDICTHGWTDYNYIVCLNCRTEYTSYADYRANDKCGIKTFTNNDKTYLSKATADEYYNGVQEISVYDYYFDFCQKYIGCPEYAYEELIVTNMPKTCSIVDGKVVDSEGNVANNLHHYFVHESGVALYWKSLEDWHNNDGDEIWRSSWGTTAIESSSSMHYPELISAVTTCSGCGATK